MCVQHCLGSVPVRLLASAPHWVQGDGFSPVCGPSLFAPLVLPHSIPENGFSPVCVQMISYFHIPWNFIAIPGHIEVKLVALDKFF